MSVENEAKLNSFHPQAYLMYLLSFDKLQDSKAESKSELQPGQPDNASVHRLSGAYKPQDVMSKLYSSRDSTGKKLIKAHFFNLETHKISSLVPELRFYKIDSRTGAKTTEDLLTPFFFPVSALADEAATSAGYSRLKASGVRNFTVNYQGTDPFTAPRYLTADLTIFVDNLANIFDTRVGFAPLADMFTISIAKGSNSSSKGSGTITPGDLSRPIEVVATLGYTGMNTNFLLEEEIEEIKEANITLRMNVIHHQINVEQDGTATISIKYTARIDNALSDKVFSATDSPVNILKRADMRQLLEEGGEDLSKINGKKQKPGTGYEDQAQKLSQIREIMEILEEKNRIFEKVTDPATISEYNTLGLSEKQKNSAIKEAGVRAVAVVDKILSGTPPAKKPPQEKIESSTPGEQLFERINRLDASTRTVHYVLFGDLIQAFFEKTKRNLDLTINLVNNSTSAILDEMIRQGKITRLDKQYILKIGSKKAKEKAKIVRVLEGAKQKLSNFKVLLPKIRYKYVKNGSETENDPVEVKEVNLADIPISLEAYQTFMYLKIANSYRNTYTIPSFLNDCVHSLLPMAFGTTWSQTGIAPAIIDEIPSLTSVTFSGPKIRSDIRKNSDLEPSEDVAGINTSSRPIKIDDASDYFVIYQAVEKNLASDKKGDLDEDSKNGIYHFQIGKNRGLIKSISFSRFDVPYAQEQLMTNQVGQYDELKMPYKADIEMFGNNLFMPGSQIFIDPSNIGFGNPRDPISPAYKLGLGGYYTVISVSTAYSNGAMSTTLGCSFGSHAEIEKETTQEQKVTRKLDNIGQAQASNDSKSFPTPKDVVSPQGSEIAVETKIQALRTPGQGRIVADPPLARAISNDYILHRNKITNKIPGVLDKKVNTTTGAVRYSLVTGYVIEIDAARGVEDSVKLVVSEGHSKYRSGGT